MDMKYGSIVDLRCVFLSQPDSPNMQIIIIATNLSQKLCRDEIIFPVQDLLHNHKIMVFTEQQCDVEKSLVQNFMPLNRLNRWNAIGIVVVTKNSFIHRRRLNERRKIELG